MLITEILSSPPTTLPPPFHSRRPRHSLFAAPRKKDFLPSPQLQPHQAPSTASRPTSFHSPSSSTPRATIPQTSGDSPKRPTQTTRTHDHHAVCRTNRLDAPDGRLHQGPAQGGRGPGEHSHPARSRTPGRGGRGQQGLDSSEVEHAGLELTQPVDGRSMVGRS